MADDDDLLDLDDDGDGNAPQTTPPASATRPNDELRKKLEKANRLNQQLTAQIAEIAKTNKTNKVSTFLAGKELDAGIAQYVLADLGDTEATDESLVQWLESKGKFFGYQAAPVLTPEQEMAQRQAAMISAASAAAGPAQSGLSVDWIKKASIKDLLAAGIINADDRS